MTVSSPELSHKPALPESSISSLFGTVGKKLMTRRKIWTRLP